MLHTSENTHTHTQAAKKAAAEEAKEKKRAAQQPSTTHGGRQSTTTSPRPGRHSGDGATTTTTHVGVVAQHTADHANTSGAGVEASGQGGCIGGTHTLTHSTLGGRSTSAETLEALRQQVPESVNLTKDVVAFLQS